MEQMNRDAGKLPGRLIVFPYWTENPFLNIAYLSARAAGVSIIPVSSPDGLQIELKRLRNGDGVHIHWTQTILQTASTEREAEDRFARFAVALDRARAKGVRILWTIHNRFPHECPFPEVEQRLCTYLADVADVIHVMSAATEEVVADLYPLDPDRVVRIPHPSFAGVYDDSFPRASARRELGIEMDEFAVLFFGQIRPYKGVERLIRAVEIARERAQVTLLLAGSVRPMDYEEEIDALIGSQPWVRRELAFIPDEQTGRWFHAADLCVFPYTDVLNSGSVELAGTFGVPTLVPAVPSMATDYRDESWVRYFGPNDSPAELATRILEERRILDQADVDAVRHSKANSPYRFSVAMKDLIVSTLRGSAAL